MKNLKLKESIANKISLAFFYIATIGMILLVNSSINDLNKKSATESEVQIAQNHVVK